MTEGHVFSLHPAAVAAVIIFGGIVAVAVALWAHYGTAVFVEMIQAGINACF
jgi:hypothetical protein